ncbi:MAG: 2-oxoisovalerate dehydrogenase [Bryobacteraceae bacterium]
MAQPLLAAAAALLPPQTNLRVSYGRIIFVVQEPPEGGYEAEALGQAIFTTAGTLDELNRMARDAVMCHFDDASRPKIIRLHSVRDEVIAV